MITPLAAIQQIDAEFDRRVQGSLTKLSDKLVEAIRNFPGASTFRQPFSKGTPPKFAQAVLAAVRGAGWTAEIVADTLALTLEINTEKSLAGLRGGS